MSAARRALALIVALGLTAGVVAASAVPLVVHASPEARVRVAFSARPERIETCRRLSDEELANVPTHMRQTVVCEGKAARYRLDVLRDGRRVVSSLVRGGGLRGDRQLYVLREIAVPPGPVTLVVRLTRLDSSATAADADETDDETDDETESDADDTAPDADDGGRDAEQRRRRAADEVPARLELRETVTLAPREVLLVTYDQVARRLRAVRGER